MQIAKRKRRENIAEYILYLWQLEDMFRALGFDPQRVYTTLVEPQSLDGEQKQMEFFWYQDLMNLLLSEGKREHGHLDMTLHLIADLNDLHLELLGSPRGKAYAELFARLAPELPKLRAKLGKDDLSDVELCFRALYSVVLLRLKGDGRHDAYIRDVLELISPVVAYLSDMYGKVERGEVDLRRDPEK